MATTLYPVILAGGSGTRLWPLSRQNYPKQFLNLNGELSLLQATVRRVQVFGEVKPIIVSNDAHYFLCQEQLQNSPLAITYLLEPCARNTAPAIACAAHHLVATIGRDALMLILPSDHWVGDTAIWEKAMREGGAYAREHEAIITFGITPDSPKTGYGYIEAGDFLAKGVKEVLSFREKPDLESAKGLIAEGNYFWNSGMFVCTAGTYLDELKKYEPDMYELTEKALLHAYHHHDFLRLDLGYLEPCKSDSIDYAIMEKTQKAALIPLSMPWSDLGCWTAVAEANNQDAQGNTLTGKVIAQDSHNCLINSESLLVTTLGIENQIIIATSDAVLVADKRYSQQVKELVTTLHKEHPQMTQDHQRVSRPWGYYEVLAEGSTFKVKRLMVKPGGKLSLQMHQHRAEHWVVVAGEAEVVKGESTSRLSVNQSTYIPQKTRHRLSNPGSEPLFVIEVQSGSYLGEDDIQRFDDVYDRKVEILDFVE